MNDHFSIKSRSVHLWRVPLADLFSDESRLFSLLSDDEKARAMRFKFATHRKRYVAARGSLRQVISLYTGIAAEKITFSYGKHGKPFLKNAVLNFNVSHSEELAVFAFSDQEIGVDIEKIAAPFKEEVAKKYFSEAEFQSLIQLSEHEQCRAFYLLWSEKEAVIKLFGEGVYTLEKESIARKYQVKDFFVHPDFAAAFATVEKPEQLLYWGWNQNGPTPLKDFTC